MLRVGDHCKVISSEGIESVTTYKVISRTIKGIYVCIQAVGRVADNEVYLGWVKQSELISVNQNPSPVRVSEN